MAPRFRGDDAAKPNSPAHQKVRHPGESRDPVDCLNAQ